MGGRGGGAHSSESKTGGTIQASKAATKGQKTVFCVTPFLAQPSCSPERRPAPAGSSVEALPRWRSTEGRTTAASSWRVSSGSVEHCRL